MPAPPREESIKRELTQATIMFGRRAIRQTDPDYFPLAVASYVLGGGSASRLYARVRDEGGPRVRGLQLRRARRGTARRFAVSAQTRTAEVAEGGGDMLREELARMAREPVTERELALAKQYLIGSFPLRLDTSAKVADFLAADRGRRVSGSTTPIATRSGIGRVTAADVQRVAAKYFAPATFSRVVVGETRSERALAVAGLLVLLVAAPRDRLRRVVHARRGGAERRGPGRRARRSPPRRSTPSGAW